jgi:hypothetical protein
MCDPCPTPGQGGMATCSGGRCGITCSGNYKKCGDRCIPMADCCESSECARGASCSSGKCTCPSGQKECNGECISGCCSNAECTAGHVCSASHTCGCASNQIECGTQCISNTACCTDQECGGSTPACDTTRRSCVPCTSNKYCVGGATCQNQECVAPPPPPPPPPPPTSSVRRCTSGDSTCLTGEICLPGGYCGKLCTNSSCDSGQVCVGATQCYLGCPCPLESGLICQRGVQDPLLMGVVYDICKAPGTLE